LKAEVQMENGLVSVENNKAVVILSLDKTTFKMTEFEAKQLLKLLKAVL
jgi:hypothetical protein